MSGKCQKETIAHAYPMRKCGKIRQKSISEFLTKTHEEFPYPLTDNFIQGF